MAAAALELLGDDDMRERFGRAGRRWAIDQFDQKTIVEKYRRVYRRALDLD